MVAISVVTTIYVVGFLAKQKKNTQMTVMRISEKSQGKNVFFLFYFLSVLNSESLGIVICVAVTVICVVTTICVIDFSVELKTTQMTVDSKTFCM